MQGSPSGPLLFSLLVNNISEALNLGIIVCYADDSYLIFEGDSWDEVCKMASEETTNVMDWLQDIGMVVNSSKTEAMYFSKHDQDGLKINVASSEITVDTTMRVLELCLTLDFHGKTMYLMFPALLKRKYMP